MFISNTYLKTGKRLPGLMSLDFCRDIQMVELEFVVNENMIHHGLLPLCRLVVVV